jgi:hypothetical protein
VPANAEHPLRTHLGVQAGGIRHSAGDGRQVAKAIYDGDKLLDWAQAYLAAARESGMTPREAVKPLAKHLGVPASELCRLASEAGADSDSV